MIKHSLVLGLSWLYLKTLEWICFQVRRVTAKETYPYDWYEFMISTSLLRTVVFFLFKEAYFYAGLLRVTSRCASRGFFGSRGSELRQTGHLGEHPILDARQEGLTNQALLALFSPSSTEDHIHSFLV